MFISISYVCVLYNTLKWYWYGANGAQSTRGCTTTIQSKSERWRHLLARHQCTIHNSRDAVTGSVAVCDHAQNAAVWKAIPA